jgi:enoyl-CoA hydratase/carnithine racemase
MADYQYFSVERDGPVAVCTFSNPPLNLMNGAMVAELTQLAGEIEADPEARAMVLTGGVEGIFVTHYDVGELAQAGEGLQQVQEYQPEELHAAHQVYNKLQAMPQVVIAALNGTTMGGGCELALACDFRFMARVGVIGCPEALVGILPGAGGTQRMARILGTAKALEMILLGRVVEADEAEAIGLIHKALDPQDLMPHTMEFARALAERPAVSVAMIKKCVHEGSQLPLLDGLKLEQECFWQTMRSEEALRLMKDYVERGQGSIAPP